MPRLRRRTKARQSLDWHDLTVNDLMTLSYGWREDDQRRNGQNFPTLESVREFYCDRRGELETLVTDRADPRWHRGRHPGKFRWVSWRWWLLLEEPRQCFDPDYEDQADEMPRGSHCWETWAGCESSFSYLHRRGLIEPGEIEAIRRLEGYHTSLTIKLIRDRLPRTRPLQPQEYASIATIWGREFLTADELKQAEPYLD